MSTMNNSLQQNITTWLSFIQGFISKGINEIIIHRTATNPHFFALPSSKLIKDQSISVLVYFIRRHVRFIVEIWTIKVSVNSNIKSKQLSLIKANKKLMTLSKTIVSCLKMLPLNSVFNNKNFDFSFDTEIEIDTQQVIEAHNKQLELVFDNYSDSIGMVSLRILYIDKAELFKKEDAIKESIIRTQIDYRTQTIKPNSIVKNDNSKVNREISRNGTTNINTNVNVNANVRESTQCRLSSQTFSLSNSSDNENEPNNFEGLKRKSLIDCSLTPYSKEGTDLFWEKNEVRNVINRYNRLYKYYCSIDQKTKEDDENNEEDDVLDVNDLFLCDHNKCQLISSSSSFDDELELAYIDEDNNNYLNEEMKPVKSSKTIQIDDIALKFSLLKDQILKKKISINTSILAKKFVS